MHGNRFFQTKKTQASLLLIMLCYGSLLLEYLKRIDK